MNIFALSGFINGSLLILIGAFVFLGITAMVGPVVMHPLGSVKVFVLSIWIYLAYFVFAMVSSVAALIQYGRRNKNYE